MRIALISTRYGGYFCVFGTVWGVNGVVGFKIGTDLKYVYAKDAQGNVVGLYYGNTIIAKYVYDAWGNCKVLDSKGKEITQWDNPAVLNPIRWKSQYYDVDSGLYWMGVRWYDSETGRYVSSASPEMLLENANVVFALNLYALCTENPVAVMFTASTFLPELDFYYNGEYKTWWEKNGWWVMLIVGAVATVIACIAAPFTCGASTAAVAIGTTLLKIAIGTAVGAAVSLAIGGTIAGIQSALTGHGFWQAFGDSVCENFVDAVTTSFAFSAVTIAASNVLKCFQCFKEGTLVETENGLKPIEEIEVGDKVLAYNEDTGEQGYKTVKQLFRNQTEYWCTVKVRSENGQETFEIISTPGHKYYLPDNKKRRDIGKRLEHIGYVELSEKWVSAESLKYGDRVLLFDGTYGIIQSVKVERLSTPEITYNFEVEDYHTYYVGKHSVCVHNANCGFGKYKDGMEMTPDDALDAANDFLGEGYRELPAKNGSRFVSKNGIRQVRMNYDDLMGLHGPGPHMNFDLLQPKFKSIHILIKG